MIEMTRCKNCGYVHLGPAPEKCPVCGAPQNVFEAYEGPGDLSGTRTLENLKAAFAGESQANRKYTLFSRVADLEGRTEAQAAFDHAAEEETWHALGHLAYMSGVGDTDANLKAAIEGEGYEFRSMYPGFAEVAEQEGRPDIAFYFKMLAAYEKKHERAYRRAAGDET